LQPDQIAKKIRKTLLTQKDRLAEYLNLLEKEEDDIINKDPDKLIAHIDLEKNILLELSLLKKVINPLETAYFKSPYKKDNSVFELKDSINKLSNQIEIKSNKNKRTLELALDNVKAELKGIRKKGITNSTNDKVDSRLVDICG
jgi:hypothetical protein